MHWKSILVLPFLLGSLHAQTIETIMVSKSAEYVQTDDNVVALDTSDSFGGPWGFDANVEGENLSGITAPTLSGPITPTDGDPDRPDATFINGGTLVYNGWEWGFGFPDGEGWDTSTQADLDAAFAAGTYDLTVLGTTLNISLSPENYPNTPQVTLTGGSWVNGRYEVPHDAELTITTNAFADYGENVQDALWLFVSEQEQPPIFDQFNLASENPTGNTMSYTVPAGTFSGGDRLEVEAGFFAGTYFEDDNVDFPGAMIVGGYEVVTVAEVVFTPIPVPQPIVPVIGTAVSITFDTQNGYTYAIEESYDLDNWTVIHPDIYGDGSPRTLYFDHSGSSTRTFRVVQTAP